MCCTLEYYVDTDGGYVSRGRKFRQRLNEFFRLLGYYPTWGDLKPTFRDYLSVPSSRAKLSFLKMGPIGSPETSVLNHLTLRNSPEDRRIQRIWSVTSQSPGLLCDEYLTSFHSAHSQVMSGTDSISISIRTCYKHKLEEPCLQMLSKLSSACYTIRVMYLYIMRVMYKVVQIWPAQTVTCLHTNSPGHIWTTLYLYSNITLEMLHFAYFHAVWRMVSYFGRIQWSLPTAKNKKLIESCLDQVLEQHASFCFKNWRYWFCPFSTYFPWWGFYQLIFKFTNSVLHVKK
jgi:hypothetical protein